MVTMKVDMADFNDVPQIGKEHLLYSPPFSPYGYNISYTAEKLSLKEFREYLEVLEEEGFCKIAECSEGLHDTYYTAVFQKDIRNVLLMYIVPFERVYINLNVDPYECDWHGQDLFQKIPGIIGKEAAFQEPVDFGAGNFVVTLDVVEENQYLSYLGELENAGFDKYTDSEIQGAVFTGTYTKEDLVVTVTYLQKMKRMTISATFQQALSPYLFEDRKSLVNMSEGTKTKLHVVDVIGGANSFVWQLKNGHFVISDGGHDGDGERLLEYLTSLVPEGEVPIVDGWFLSHGHIDHMGALLDMAKPENADRICIEGVYYNEPNKLVHALDPGLTLGMPILIKNALKKLKTTSGTEPKLYRPQTGQKYYFCDVVLEIVFAQEQLPYENYSGDYNDSGTWCMFCVEGQRVLIGGDGDKGGFRMMMDIYDKSYFDVELFSLLHHGHNTRDFITDYCTVQTVLDTGFTDELPSGRAKENAHLRDVTKEWISRRDGAKVLSFPYEVGQYQNFPKARKE